MCSKVSQARYVVLFSDALLYGEYESGNADPSMSRVKFHKLIPLSGSATVKERAEKKDAYYFQLTTSSKGWKNEVMRRRSTAAQSLS
jgi:hypothetical protein